MGRRICADNAILMIYFELNCIIAYLALITEIPCITINERTRLIERGHVCTVTAIPEQTPSAPSEF